MRFGLIPLTLTLTAFAACSKLDNAADQSRLTCGVVHKAGYRLVKIDQSEDFDALFIASSGENQRLEPTKKGCLSVSESWTGTLYIRGKNSQDQGLSISSKDVGSQFTRLKLSNSDRLVQKTMRLQCPEAKTIQNQLLFKALTSDNARAHLPSTLMSIRDSKNQPVLNRQILLNDSQVIEKLELPDGKYQLSLENFDAFNPSVREPAQNCEIIVDNSRPILAVSGSDINEVRPGQVLAFPSSDDTQVQIHLCAKKRESEETATLACRDDEYIPIKDYSASENGIWDLSYYAKDQAGNISRTGQQTIAVFHRETIEQIKLLSKEFRRLTSTTGQQFKAFKTYQTLVSLAQKLTLKAEIKEVYWKLLGNFATVSDLTLVSRRKIPGQPPVNRGSGTLQTVVQKDPAYPYKMTIVRNGIQHEFKIYDTRYPKLNTIGFSISIDQDSYAAILRLHPKIPYLVYVAAGRFLLEYDLRKIRYTGSGDHQTMNYETLDEPRRELAAEHAITSFTLADDGRSVTVNTIGGWSETHVMNSANQSLWPQKKICGRGLCRFNLEKQVSVAYDRATKTITWQADKEGLEKKLENPVDIYDWEELDGDNILLLGRDNSLRIWSPRDGKLKELGKTPHNAYFARYQSQFHAAIIDGGDDSSVLVEHDGTWQRLDRVFRGEFIHAKSLPLPIFKYEDSELGIVIDIYDKNFGLLKTIPIVPTSSIELSVKGAFLYFISETEDRVERIDLIKQETLEPIPLPPDSSFEAAGDALVLKKWDNGKDAFGYYEFMPEDGRLVPLNYQPVDNKNPEGTVVDKDGERFYLSPWQYYFIDAFHGIHIDRDDGGVFFKDEFTVDASWFDQRLRTRSLYKEAE